jgi:cell division protein FtsI (penicillin-binding protein 3)
MANYTLLGKTGTAVRFEGGRYVKGEYTASFAALFPADRPQLVVIVKIDNPKGKYYGGLTAAPVTRTMLQQALASRRIAIDRSRLADTEGSQPRHVRPRQPVARDIRILSWPNRRIDSAVVPRVVPDVVGRSVREAALALHERGFRVSLRGMGQVSRTEPAEGETATPGMPVVVWAD